MKGNNAKRLRVLVVENESDLKDLFRRTADESACVDPPELIFDLSQGRMGNSAIEKVQMALQEDDPFAVVLMDSVLSANSEGIWTGAQIRKIDAKVNFVFVADTLDIDLRGIIARIPPENKVLFLQKPFHEKALVQFVTAAGAMWLTEKELQKANAELQELNTQLWETNNALSVLARNLDGNRRESENRIIQRTRTLIIPVIEKLQRERNLEKYSVELDLLLDYIENLTADLASDLKIASALSATELRIASLVKNGMSSEEIARHENLSIYTIKTHRKNIRKKLNLRHSGINLRAYLESEEFKDKF